MFQDLDATLRTMLADAAAPADVRGADVSFDTPDKDFKPTQATVNLFLYDVEENRTLRDDTPLMDRVGDGYVSRQPPLRVDCSYLTTAWSPKTGGLKAEEEHRLLGLALLWLGRFQVIEDRFLQGSMRNPPQLYPLPAMVAQMKEGQGMGQFWSALGVAPRPAFTLTVTIGLPSFDQVDEYPAVTAIRVETTSSSHPTLVGRVLDSALAPVPAARVTVVETGQEATVGSSGQFAFTGLDFGRYTLLVRAADRPEVRAPVAYEAHSQVHNVILPGR